MGIKIINADLGIGACIPADILEEDSVERPLKKLPFFYFKKHDLIILNEEHSLYELFKDVIIGYLELDNSDRISAAERAATSNVLRITVDILNEVIEYRQ